MPVDDANHFLNPTGLRFVEPGECHSRFRKFILENAKANHTTCEVTSEDYWALRSKDSQDGFTVDGYKIVINHALAVNEMRMAQ